MARKTKERRKAHRPPGRRRASDKRQETAPRRERPGPQPLVVGMVASAGGLDAYKNFLQAMPEDSGMAFVLVPHLDPRRDSLMASLLAKYTSMPLAEATDGARLEPNRVHVIPPNRYLAVRDNVLRLTGPIDGASAPAIDAFLRSLAEDRRERAVCVILSGTGSYGTIGLKAVKAAGGLAVVQDPRGAEYEQMPQSAVDTGLADYVLPVTEMPEALAVYARHLQSGRAAEPQEHAPLPDALNAVVGLLRARTQLDFRFYRKRMLMRRVQRRMGLVHAEQLEDYITMLRARPEELKLLAKDLLISVTSFFRDQDAYQILQAKVVAPLIQAKAEGEPVRIWVPGCATGEEAYSIAMLFMEHMARVQKELPLQVFATDVDPDALEVARRGIYPEGVLADVGEERIGRFFTRTDRHHCQVTKRLRDAVMFAPQNLLTDAPFSRLDLVSCRNVLIYLEPAFQEKVIALLEFSLNPTGYLLLGPSETIGKNAAFRPVSKKWRLYQRSGLARRGQAAFPISGAAARREARPPEAPPRRQVDALDTLAQKMLLEEYAPAAVLVNGDYAALSYWGRTERYLRQRSGAPTQDITLLAREGMGARIRVAVHKALSSRQRVSLSGASIRVAGRLVPVRVTALPVRGAHAGAGLFVLLTFQGEPRSRAKPAAAPSRREDESLVRRLEHELKVSREEVQSAIEEMESSNEELKASNEEVMSMNEELQSANEELETSKEEMQSVNEELQTVNSQLQEKIEQLTTFNNDMTNLLNSAEVATVFLRPDGSVARYTPAATKLFNLIPSDIGRPIGHVTRLFRDDALAADIKAVLSDLAVREVEVSADEDHWYVRRASPYRTHDDRIEGVVLVFNDITPLKRAERELRQLAENLELRVDQRTEALRSEVAERDRAEQRSSAQAAELLRVYRVHTAGALAASVAHELNQPLAAIASYCEVSLQALRREAQPSDKLISNVEKALEQTQRAAGVIRELRTFLAQESPGGLFTEMNETVRTVRHLLSLEAETAGVTISLALAEDLKPCRGARVPIEHVLVNLVRNSIEAIALARIEGGNVRITTHMVEEAVQVTVADNGPGLRAEDARLMFDAFFAAKAQAQAQAQALAQALAHGMGMGLSVCRSIVSSYGGEIWVDQPRGPGTIIHFTLPLN